MSDRVMKIYKLSIYWFQKFHVIFVIKKQNLRNIWNIKKIVLSEKTFLIRNHQPLKDAQNYKLTQCFICIKNHKKSIGLWKRLWSKEFKSLAIKQNSYRIFTIILSTMLQSSFICMQVDICNSLWKIHIIVISLKHTNHQALWVLAQE